jgi:hypothetical protein
MPKNTLNSVARLIYALTFAVVFAPAAGAQSREASLRPSELRRSSAASLYDAIAELRPQWLLTDADPQAVPMAQRVVVFLNGRHVGYMDALRGIQTAQAVAVHFRSPEYVRRTVPSFPHEQYAAALFVSTRAEPSMRPQGRVTVSLDAGYNIRSLPLLARDALRAQGYTADYADAPVGISPGQDEGTTTPFTFGGTVNYLLRGGWGGALTVNHTLEGRAGGMDRDRSLEAVSTTLTSSEAALLLTREASVVRVGMGPAVRTASWSWSDGFCDCGTQDKSSNAALGMAGEMAVSLPFGSFAVLPQLRVLARYYPSQSTEFSGLDEPLQAGGVVVTMGLSAAMRF